MTIIAKRSVQLNGHIYSKGEAAEYDGPIDSRIAELFMTKDGEPLKGATNQPPPPKGKKGTKENTFERIDKLVKELGRKGIEQKLDELGVGYNPKMTDNQIAMLLLQQQGEV